MLNHLFKKLLLLAPLGLASAWLLTGCGECCSHHGDPGETAGKKDTAKLDTSAVEKAFASAEASVKATADKAIAAVQKADYGVVVTETKQLLQDVKLTPQQKDALNKLLADTKTALESAASTTAAKVSEAAQKAAQDVKNALPSSK